jgi:hypothetical protein
MFSNFSQQLPGLQPGIYGNAWSGHELGPQGAIQQSPPWAGQINPFAHNPLVQPTFNLSPAALHNPIHMVPVLGQLAQQLAIQSAVTQQVAQQVSLVVQQLAH